MTKILLVGRDFIELHTNFCYARVRNLCYIWTEWSPIRFVIIQMIRKLEDCEAGMVFTSMIIDRVGRHEVLLPITHNQYNFQKKKIHLGQMSAQETITKVENSYIWKFISVS